MALSALPVLGAVAVASLGATSLTMRLALKSCRSKVVGGREEMAGASGQVLDLGVSTGHVHGER